MTLTYNSKITANRVHCGARCLSTRADNTRNRIQFVYEHSTMASSAIPADGICFSAYQFDITHQRYRETAHACILRKRPTTRPILNGIHRKRWCACCVSVGFDSSVLSARWCRYTVLLLLLFRLILLIFCLVWAGWRLLLLAVWPAVIDVVVFSKRHIFFVRSRSLCRQHRRLRILISI